MVVATKKSVFTWEFHAYYYGMRQRGLKV